MDRFLIPLDTIATAILLLQWGLCLILMCYGDRFVKSNDDKFIAIFFWTFLFIIFIPGTYFMMRHYFG